MANLRFQALRPRLKKATAQSFRLLMGLGVGICLLGCVDLPFPPQAENPAPTPTPTPSVPAFQGQLLPVTAEVRIGNQVIGLEVAATPSQQQLGLMYRSELAADRGMLFPFVTPQPTRFWMRNVVIPLDMVFLRAGVVQAIFANVPPCTTAVCPTYGPDGLIDQVIELRGGRAAELGLNVGDRVAVQFLQPNLTSER
jgi:hypothetical protein